MAERSTAGEKNQTKVKPARLFVGTFLPASAQESLESLTTANQSLGELWQHKLRWVKRAKLHITWLFLGNVDQSLIPALSEAIEKCVFAFASAHKGEHLTIEYDRIECWPSQKKPRLIVLTPSHPQRPIIELGKQIRSHLAHFAEQEEDKEFRPHVTLARAQATLVKGSPLAARKASVSDIKSPSGLFPLKQEISEISLIESHLGAGDQYEEIARFELFPSR
ncbi:MAG TPA: RNA 2',3'-cyclic phosphodiesterase [Candidatus Obscuribacterales bacterium]